MIEYSGLALETAMEVYEPSDDSFLAADFVQEYLDRLGKGGIRAIDIGTGTGILGLVAARSKKVRSMVLSDIDPKAVSLALSNYRRNREHVAAECSFVKSDMFSEINGCFDMIIFNAPYLRHEEKAGSGGGWWDGGPNGIEVSKRFLAEAVGHLSRAGVVFLVYSSLGAVGNLKAAINDLGMCEVNSRSLHLFFEDIVVSMLSCTH
ncbi:MAG: methyltransferase [Candidatus Marsarchaeota archaeon]|jgi:HemK-related putative methylase|nr:methyltransferase [Candidatus Marsarchaeota archaeon]